jgi:hypothetical protein
MAQAMDFKDLFLYGVVGCRWMTILLPPSNLAIGIVLKNIKISET